MVLNVSYDLHQPGRDYEKIAAVLKKASSWARPLQSVWFLDTNTEVSVWRDRLAAAGDPSDEFFVARMRQTWASHNMGNEMNAWLKNPARTW